MSPYEIFELSEDASIEEVEKAWRKKASIHHPDKGGSPELFRLYRTAYEEIKNKTQAKSYYDEFPPPPPRSPKSDFENFDFNKPRNNFAESNCMSSPKLGTGYFSSHFYGEQPLWKSYWINFVLLGLPFDLFISAFLTPSVGNNDTVMEVMPFGWIIIVLCFYVVYDYWALIGLYRSASLSKSFWRFIVIFQVIVNWIIVLGIKAFIIGSLLSNDSPLLKPITELGNEQNIPKNQIIDTACKSIGAEEVTNPPKEFLGMYNGATVSANFICGRQGQLVVNLIVSLPNWQLIDNITFNHYEQITTFNCLNRTYKVHRGIYYDIHSSGGFTVVKQFVNNEDKWIVPLSEMQKTRLNLVCN